MPYKSFVFRIYPNQMQKVFFEKTFGCARLVYNIFLSRRIDCYLKENRRMTYTQYHIHLTKVLMSDN
ncbi:MAG: helix-turn-helix domain-containing protein [Clostridia bacterium]|nr:helix-turn-helix domain-containing protein [Clostridia bacterium]